MDNKDSAREFGRLRYVEPTNICLNREGSYSDAINFPYEDYNIAVDLTIRQTNRYSCGWWTQDGSMNEVTFSSGNGTISFLGGTRGYSSQSNSDDSYFTTNFTDVSMTSPETNTSECLGIESISISYNSWMYPQVVIKFVDVRGATVMLPAEKGYYNPSDAGNSSAIYQSLFSFPYPMFILKVKGFYGKGVTYRLAVHKTNFEMDASTGNFNITVDFIGYMYGIYSDIPMTFLAAAPFMERGKEYWQQKITSGEFTFRNSDGSPGNPMVTIPELRLKLAQAAQNEAAISAAADGAMAASSFDERLELIVSLKDNFPFKTWFNPPNIPYTYGFFKTAAETIQFVDAVSGYTEAVSAYDYTYKTSFLDNMESLKKITDAIENKFGGDKNQMMMYLGRLHFVTVKKDGKDTYDLDDKSFDGLKDFAKDIYNQIIGQAIYGTSPREVYEKKVVPYQEVAGHIDSVRNGLTDFYIVIFPKGNDAFFNQEKFLEAVNAEHKNIMSQKDEQTQYYKSKENGIIEKVLGFRPSIKNIYDLMFAHMDTFIHTFYDSTKLIKDQLENDKPQRAKSTYDIKDGDTDTEREKIKTPTGDVLNTNDRCKYLPPYAAYYKPSYDGIGKSSEKMVLRWPEEVRNGANLEEIKYINELIAATETYFQKSEDVDEMIALMNSSGTNKVDTTFTNGAPSFNVSEFIPLTTFDFVNKDRMQNPYKYIASKAYEGDNTIEGEILTTFALRAFYYLSVNAKEWFGQEDAFAFGKIEAINVFKSVGDKYSTKFIDFIKRFADGKYGWIERIIVTGSLRNGDGWDDLTNTWKNKGVNLNNYLFGEYDVDWDLKDYITYRYHKGFKFTKAEADACIYRPKPDKKYEMFPLYADNFGMIENYYLKDKEMLGNPNMMPTRYDGSIYGGNRCDATTFFMYDGCRDYIKNIYIAIEDEIKRSQEEATKMNSEYGNRDNSSYGGISDASAILREYKDNIASEFNDNTYVTKAIVDCKGKEFKADEVCRIIADGTYSNLQQLFIKVPSMDFSLSDDGDSIFNHPLYQAQTDIKAKAYLFIQSVPILGNESGIDESNRNGLSLKCKLLREGAYYWYMQNPDKVKFETKINKKTKKYKVPKGQETLIAEFTGLSSIGNLFSSRSSMATVRILDNNDRNEGYRKWEYPKGCTGCRVRTLKKFFEDWATSTNQISGFAANEARLTNKNLYGRKLKKQDGLTNFLFSFMDYEDIEKKIKEGGDESEFFENDASRNYKYGLDIVFLAGGEKQSPDAFEARKLQEFLRDLFFGVCTTFDYFNGIAHNDYDKDSKGLMVVRTIYLSSALKGFMEGLKEIYGKTVEDLKENTSEYYRKMAEAEANNPFNSTDLKLSTYMSVKNLYDKWLCSPYNGPEDTWVLKRSEDSYSDFDSFKYADSFYNDIGNALLVNVSKVSNWLDSCMPTSNMNTTEGVMGYTGRTLYEYLTEIAQDCGGTLMALPQKFGLAKADDVNSMFTPMSIKSNWDEDSSTFIFMYTYKPSEHLGDTETSTRDMNGWDAEGDGLDLTDDEIVGRVLENSENGFIVPAFGVTYGKQNQSIFRNIQLSTATQGVTEAGIAATMNIASKASQSPRESTLFGQDLYRVFSNYSYQCNVETMGNTQILPLMYFQLNNVPLWKGAYMIKKVTHNITAGNMTTSFEGIRINRYAIPISDGTVIIEKQTGNETPEEEPKVAGGDTKQTTGPQGQVSKADDVAGNMTLGLKFKIQFDESNITKEKPIIYIFPPHSERAGVKKDEWEWGGRLVDKIIDILKGYQFYDGTSYSKNLQRGLRKDSPYYKNGYTGGEAYALVDKYGSEKVITLVPHWNAGAGNYYCALKGGTQEATREDSIAFMNCIVKEAEEIKAKRNTYTTLPPGMLDGSCKVRHYFGEKSNDPGTMPKCACAMTENWFADYCSKGKTESKKFNNIRYTDAVWEKDNGRWVWGKGWLNNEGFEDIAQCHARGIKRYIDTLKEN